MRDSVTRVLRLYAVRDKCYNPRGVEFRILGPLEVVAGGEVVPLGSRKARALLALLLLRVNEVVSTDRLLDDVWGERPPPTATLHNVVARLRKTLGSELIVSRPHGYMLQLAPDQLDLSRFERLVEEARGANRQGRAERLREALALWRGPALDDLAFEPFVELEAARLEELRLAVLEDRIEADLALGRHRELVGELEGLVREHPLRERLRGQLMLALYRSGRQAEALDAYQEGRRTLVDELGIEPSPALRQLEQAILRQDEALEPEPVPAEREPSAARGPTEWRRRTVTVLFAEVELTAAGGAVDPEAASELAVGIRREFAEADGAHDGTVVELRAESAMAVFGVSFANEDDALRAVRAAADLRDAVDALARPLDERGLRIDLRVGVNTGEVLAAAGADEDTEVSGDPVVVARRLQEHAVPGEIVLGPSTLTLVRHAVSAEPMGPIAIRGRPEPVASFRFVRLDEEAPGIARRLETPLIGREAELEQVRRAFAAAQEERRCTVLRIVGEPGIGKTRLANEVAAELAGQATVLSARCPPYGTGATWLPLLEIVAQLGGVDAVRELLADEDDGDVVVRRIGELAGLAEGSGSSGEAFWAVRRLLEALARERPLVLVLEDLHAAEPTFLDALEYLEQRVVDAAVLVVATGRPELLELRPDWHGPALTLAPLDDAEAAQLVDYVTGGDAVASTRARVLETAEGNPLFVEQLLAFATETGDPTALPPTLDALLTSRLDLLDPAERAVLERAAVIGREFWHGAVVELSPDGDAAAVRRRLLALVRRGLVHPADSAFASDDAYQFHHALIRDAAYAAISKATRAELHERLADWFDRQQGGQDELSGTHLEHAFHYREEVGQVDRAARRLAEDAGARLGRAGIRAFKRGDIPATVNLLERATALLPTSDAFARELACEFGLALRTAGELERAERVLGGAVDASVQAHDRRLELRARLELANVRLFNDPHGKIPELLRIAESATPTFEALGDDRSLARTWVVRGAVRGAFAGRLAEYQQASELALHHLTRAQWPPIVAVTDIAACALYGPERVEDGLRRCAELLESHGSSLVATALVSTSMAGLEGMRAGFDIARAL